MIPHDRYGKRTGDDRPVEPPPQAGTSRAERRTPGAFGHVPGTPRPRPVHDTSLRAARLKHARMMRRTAKRARGAP